MTMHKCRACGGTGNAHDDYAPGAPCATCGGDGWEVPSMDDLRSAGIEAHLRPLQDRMAELVSELAAALGTSTAEVQDAIDGMVDALSGPEPPPPAPTAPPRGRAAQRSPYDVGRRR